VGDAGVVQEHVIGEAVDGQGDGMADDGAGLEMESHQAAVHRRVVILDTGRYTDETRLEVADEGDEIVSLHRLAGDFGERADERDRQRRGAAEAGAARGVGAGGDADSGQMKVLERAMDQRRFRIGGQLVDRGVAMLVLLVGQIDFDRVIAGLGYLGFGVIGNRHVDRARSGMEEVERPEVESTASEIGAHRRADSDLFHIGLGCFSLNA